MKKRLMMKEEVIVLNANVTKRHSSRFNFKILQFIATLSIPTCDIDGICGPGTCVPDGNGFYCLCPPTHYEIKGVNDGSCQGNTATVV